jgi:MoaA/NifB/PqqE/SkfB family radical SAM enzyme
MDRFFRYYSLLKNASWGRKLPQGSLLNYLKIRLGILDITIGNRRTLPSMIMLYCVKRCNLKCSFCSCGGFPEKWQENELTIEKFKRILELNMVKKAILICFSGGEPLLNKDLPELVRMARAKKHLAGLITNGILLENKVNELSEAGVCDIQLSIYEETRDKLRAILPKVSSVLPINASYVLLKSKLIKSSVNNYSDLLEIINMCKETNCASLKFNLCQPQYKTDDISETISIGDDLYDRFIDVCKKSFKDAHFSGYNCGFSFPTKKFTVFFPNPVAWKIKERWCRNPWSIINLDANGNFIICCKMLPIDGSGGCLFDGENTVVNSEKALKIRNCLLHPGEDLEPECINCMHNNKSYASDI